MKINQYFQTLRSRRQRVNQRKREIRKRKTQNSKVIIFIFIIKRNY
jgi:hypothetical protein